MKSGKSTVAFFQSLAHRAVSFRVVVFEVDFELLVLIGAEASLFGFVLFTFGDFLISKRRTFELCFRIS